MWKNTSADSEGDEMKKLKTSIKGIHIHISNGMNGELLDEIDSLRSDLLELYSIEASERTDEDDLLMEDLGIAIGERHKKIKDVYGLDLNAEIDRREDGRGETGALYITACRDGEHYFEFTELGFREEELNG